MTNPFTSNKILAHLEDLHEYASDRFFPPIYVEIDPTNRCASACPWCAGYLNRPESKALLLARGDDETERLETSTAGIKSLLKDLHDIGVQAVTWTGGGDPTQHKNITQIVEHAANLGFEQGFITHGIIPIESILKHVEWIRFSVDGASVDGYGKQHGKPEHFHIVLENIRSAVNHKTTHNLDCTIGVGFLTQKETWHEIVPFAELWREIDVDYIQYRPLHDTHGNKHFSDNNYAIKKIRKAKEVDPRVVWSEPKYKAMIAGERGMTEHCHGIYFTTAISADSNGYPCCHLKGDMNFSIGNLLTEKFSDIWFRHQSDKHFAGPFITSEKCPAFCRHYGTNQFISEQVLLERQHKNFL